MTATRPAQSGSGLPVRWELDHDDAQDLLQILGVLEDFLRLASHDVVDELAQFPIARPLDPSRWAHWLADYLGDQAIALRAATATATASFTSPGELS
jgi:hypothetical protein